MINLKGETQWTSNFRDSRREAALNWLALGLLLAAWNASDNDSAKAAPRPERLRAYPYVSVRAANRMMPIIARVTKPSTYCKARYL